MEPKLTPRSQVSPDLKTTTGLKCECGNQIFSEGILLRKVSKFLTGNTQDSLMPIAIFYCVKCSTPIQGMIPMDIRSEFDSNIVKS